MAWAIVTAILAFFTLLPVAGMALAWSYFAWRCRHPYPAPNQFPEIAVVLSLRGADPSLESCLTGVLAQDYPAYQVHIVVDSAEDPAHAVVKRVLARGHAPNAKVYVDTRRILGERCSAKLSAQRQVLTSLDDAVTVLMFLDADSVPSAGWLRAMVAPFSNPRVGVATGIRWSGPLDEGWGTLARYVFNVLSFPQRFLYRIPWGGSLAVRRSALQKSGLVDHWSRCFGEDTSAYGPLRAAGFRLAFVPAATQINSEPVNLGGVHNFILRQIVSVRLHHVNWPVMLAVNAATIISYATCFGLALFGVIGAATSMFGVTTAWWKLSAFAIIPLLYWAGLLVAMVVGDHLVRRVAATPPRPDGLAKFIWAASIALAFSSDAILKAPFLRSIDWRGLSYDIEGRDRVRMRTYQPYRGTEDGTVASHAIV